MVKNVILCKVVSKVVSNEGHRFQPLTASVNTELVYPFVDRDIGKPVQAFLSPVLLHPLTFMTCGLRDCHYH